MMATPITNLQVFVCLTAWVAELIVIGVYEALRPIGTRITSFPYKAVHRTVCIAHVIMRTRRHPVFHKTHG